MATEAEAFEAHEAYSASLPLAEYRRLISLGGALETHRGINIQRPWAELLLSGEKTVEARRYPLKGYRGEELWAIQTTGPSNRRHEELKRIIGMRKHGQGDEARLGHRSGPQHWHWKRSGWSTHSRKWFAPAGRRPAASIIGLVCFADDFQYENYAQWRADEPHHCIPAGSEYDWQPETGPMYGWRVSLARRLSEPQAGPAQKGVISSRAVTRVALFDHPIQSCTGILNDVFKAGPAQTEGRDRFSRCDTRPLFKGAVECQF